jgi:hypothetical protein
MTRPTVTFEKLTAQRIVLNGSIVVYEPSVYGGDGTEERKNITLTLTPTESQVILALEQDIDVHMLSSVLQDGTIKAKITTSSVRVYGEDERLSQLPEQLRDTTVNAVLLVKGVWKSKTQSGLSIEVTDLQILASQPHECPL